MTYQLLLTTLGQAKIAAAANAGAPPIAITQFAVGQGVDVDFSTRLNEQVLVSKRYQGAVASVAQVTGQPAQYEITCIVPQDFGGWTIREMGLVDADGDLIWVGQLPNVQKPAANSTSAVDYRIKAVVRIDNPDVNLIIDANVVTATKSWVNSAFTPIGHLTDADPHSQYVLTTVYDAHVAQNASEHSQFSSWQQNHLTNADPHPQYAMSTEVAELIASLSSRITALESTAGIGILVAELIISFSDAAVSQNDFGGAGTVSVIKKQGYEFTYPSSYNLMIPSIESSYDDIIIIGLPAEYDSTQHRLVITSNNGSYQINETDRCIDFTVHVSVQADDEQTYIYSLDALFGIEIYNK